MTTVRNRHQEAHKRTVDFTISDIARFLQETLGTKLVAHIADVADPKAVSEWAKGTRNPRPEAEKRLRAAFHVFRLLQDDENSHTARAWFIGMNPQLTDDAPADALKDGRFKDVLAAARAYVEGG